MTQSSVKTLPAGASLEQLRKQAKELLTAHRNGDSEAVARFAAHHSHPSSAPKLSDAQLVIAREHGFPSWPRLKRHVESVPAELVEQFKTAVQSRDAGLVRELLVAYSALRARVDEPWFDFDAPAIVYSAGRHDRAMVEALLDAGADINARSRWWAGGFGVLPNADADLAAYLIERGAKVDVHAAAGMGQLETLKTWLEADPALVHARGGDGQTPLHIAQTPEIACLLVEFGADIEARDVDHGSTPAQYAAVDRPDVCRFLRDKGAQGDIFMACALGDVETVTAWVKTDPSLLHALTDGSGPHNPDPAPGGHIYRYTLGFDSTPLAVAARLGNRELVDTLLSLGADINALDGNETALHHAAWVGNTDMVRYLLAHGADPMIEDREYHATPEGWAEHNGQTETRDVLREQTGGTIMNERNAPQEARS